MRKAIASVVLVFACAAAWALPTNQEVEAAVQSGKYAQAETMMGEVVAAKPGSARAHYVFAEILAHNAEFTKASAEAKKARELDPKIAFTQPEKFEAFERMLVREQAQPQTPRAQSTPSTTFNATASATVAPSPVPAERAGGIPGWVWGAGLLVVGFLLWRGFNRSRSAPTGMMAGAGVNPGYAAAPAATGYGSPSGAAMTPSFGPGMPMAPPRPSSGLLGTGLAVAGGLAGGMLLDEMLHPRQSAGSGAANSLMPGPIDRPPTDDAAARALEERPVDFGNGDDWDAGGSSVDMGGGTDDSWN